MRPLKFIKLFFVLSLSLIFPFQQSLSANKFWSCNGIDYWDNANCWNPLGQPTTTDDVFLTQSDGVDRTVLYRNSNTVSLGGIDTKSITVDATGSGSMTLLQNQDLLAVVNITVGLNGIGTITQTGGANRFGSGGSNTTLMLGGNSAGNGTYNLYNGEFRARIANIGINGTGTFNMSGGFAQMEFFYGLGKNGTINMSGGYLDSAEGGTSTGSKFNQSGGIYNMIGTGGGGFGIGGTYNLSGGTFRNGARFRLLNTGTFNMTGGIMIAGNEGPAGLENKNKNIAGNFNLSGGNLYMERAIVESGGSFNFTGGTLSVEHFTGDLFNNGGTINPDAIIFPSQFTIAPDPTMKMINSTSIIGDYSQSALGTLALDFGGTGVDEFDFMDISGTAILDGILEVSLFDLGSGVFNPSLGDSFDILFADTIIGQFDTLDFAYLDGGLEWGLTYILSDFSTDILQLNVIASPVPLPASFWLFGAGLVGMVGIVRRKKTH